MATYAVDYDGTITSDIELFKIIMQLMMKAGHTVIIVTMRYDTPSERIPEGHYPEGVKIYYTERDAKIPFMERQRVPVNVWIEDNPRWLFEDAL